MLEPAITFVKQNATYLGAGITGLTTAGALIIRKVRNLSQTKNAISEQNETLQSNLLNTNVVNSKISEELKEAKQKLSVYEGEFGGDVVSKVQGLSTELQDAQRTITTQQSEIKIWADRQRSLEAERNFLQSKIVNLQHDLDVAEGRVKLPIP